MVRGGLHVVERGRLVRRADLRVLVPLVVDDLVLVAERAADFRAAGPAHRGVLGHEVLHAAVAAGLHLPREAQVEVGVGVGRDEVALAERVLALSAGGSPMQPSCTAQRRPVASGFRYPRQPFIVVPSNSSVQPAAFSSAVSVFGGGSAGDATMRATAHTTSEAMTSQERLCMP